MLVLTRKPGESIVLGNNIKVMVVEIAPGVVRLGIDAPREVSILRAELHGEVQGENLRSMGKERLPNDLLGSLRGRATGRGKPPKNRPDRDR